MGSFGWLGSIVFLASITAAYLPEYIKANYTKYEHMIPMRDGVKLFTAVYVPKEPKEPAPIMLLRTPYSVAPYGSNNYRENLGPSEKFVKEGFIVAYQDVRGKHKSEGTYMNVRPYRPSKSGPKDFDETTDTYDTIEWLVKNVPDNNGKVGMWGISYPGFYAAMGAIDAHPALKASSPQAPVSDWFIGDDFRHNGAFFLAHAFTFFARFGRTLSEPGTIQTGDFSYGTSDGYDFFLRMGPLANADEKHFKNQIAFWKELLRNDTYNEFWKERNIVPHMRKLKPALMTVGGWFDAEDVYGPLRMFENAEKNPGSSLNMLVMGPWYHGQWGGRNDGDKLGSVPFNAKTSRYYRDNIEFPFFDYYLRGKGDGKLPKAYVFETGRNQWRKHAAWPPKAATPRELYFREGGVLDWEAPAATGESFDDYVSDPAKPVPFIADTAVGMTREYMVDDQRFASHRTDVLVYQTAVLESDVSIAGPLTASLHVSTTGTDSDWVVKLIDVFDDTFPDPDPNPKGVRMGGYQMLVRGEPMRGKFRKSFEKPEPFTPGKVEKVEFTMPDVYHTFRRGHRIMVHVQSSWFPLVDRNPQKFLPIHEAKTTDFQKATQRVYRTKATPSYLRVNVLP